MMLLRLNHPLGLGTSHYGDDSTGCHIHAKLVIVPVRREDEALRWPAALRQLGQKIPG